MTNSNYTEGEFGPTELELKPSFIQDATRELAKTSFERAALGEHIHKLLNKALIRKLSTKEYTELCLLIADVFDLSK